MLTYLWPNLLSGPSFKRPQVSSSLAGRALQAKAKWPSLSLSPSSPMQWCYFRRSVARFWRFFVCMAMSKWGYIWPHRLSSILPVSPYPLWCLRGEGGSKGEVRKRLSEEANCIGVGLEAIERLTHNWDEFEHDELAQLRCVEFYFLASDAKYISTKL